MSTSELGTASRPSGPHRFSVIVPTRERADTLAAALRTITAQDYDKLEIIVSDNCSADDTRAVVDAARDPRIRYVNPGRRLSMSENWEFALGHATGEWVTIVGDDDGLLPGCLTAVSSLIHASGAKAVRTRACWYEWPSVTRAGHGRLHVPIDTGWTRRTSREWRRHVLAGRADYYDLPMLYTGGFVSASVIGHARTASGRYFRSSIPDVYSALVNARVLSDYVFSKEPVAVFGTSSHSTGHSQFGGASDTKCAANLFLQEGNIPFHGGVPVDADGQLPKAIQALVYEAYLQVEEVLPEPPPELPVRQLAVILAAAGPHRAAVDEWGRRFAAMHGLDFDQARTAARRHALSVAVRRFPGRAVQLLRTCNVGSHALPLRDIHEASVAASVLKTVRPARLSCAAKNVRSHLAKLWREQRSS